MEQENNKFLPIGSVVILNSSDKEFMICGFLMKNEKDELFDYSACLYPEGLVGSDQIIMFNHDRIRKIVNLGYSNDNDKLFRKKLIEFIK